MTNYAITDGDAVVLGPASWSNDALRKRAGLRGNGIPPETPYPIPGTNEVLREVVYPDATGTDDVYSVKVVGAPVRDGDVVSVPSQHQDLSVAEARAAGKAAATAKFREVRAAGTTVGGAQIATDMDAVVELRELASLLEGTEDTQNVVTRSGARLSIDYDTAVALIGANTTHYQSAVNREYALHVAIDAAEDLTELRAIDLDSGWPS